MVYGPAPNKITIALTGDTVICHRLSVLEDERFLHLVKILRDADVSFTNLECVVQAGEDYPAYVAAGSRKGRHSAAPPYCLQELQWMGIKMVSTANNHSADFGEGGLLTNIRYLDVAGMTHAGTGHNLTEASAPAYLDTAKGRIALIAASDWGPRGKGDLPYPGPMGVMAAEQGPYSKGRPGVNLIRFDIVFTVDRTAFDALRRTSSQLGWEKEKTARRQGGGWDMPLSGESVIGGEQDTDTEFHFMGTKFVLGEPPTFSTVPYQADLERNYKWVREARRQADYVVVSFHNNGATRSPDVPPDHTRIFAHGAIDAGADVFVAHGGLRGGGIELYKGKPIIYGIPGLVVHSTQLPRVPYELMARFGLGFDDTPTDLYEAQERMELGLGPGPSSLESFVIEVTFKEKELEGIRIHPVELPWRATPRPQQGIPLLAPPGSEISQRVLERLTQLCEPFGNKLQTEDGTSLLSPS